MNGGDDEKGKNKHGEAKEEVEKDSTIERDDAAGVVAIGSAVKSGHAADGAEEVRATRMEWRRRREWGKQEAGREDGKKLLRWRRDLCKEEDLSFPSKKSATVSLTPSPSSKH